MFMGRGTTFCEFTVFDTRLKATDALVPFRLAGRQPVQAGRLCYPVFAETPMKWGDERLKSGMKSCRDPRPSRRAGGGE